jgi:ubiquitin carboxyl-terminal hydrolase 25/28
MMAIQESMETEPIQMDQRDRDPDIPVGLKNVGNTCYFNSFMQAFFFLPNL